MAAPRRVPHSSLTARLGREPWKFRFFQAVRLLERRRARQPASNGAVAPVGEEVDPRQRIVRFAAATRLAFPTSEIEDVADAASGPPAVAVTFLGLTGAAAVLPQHYSVAVSRELRNHNTALRDFFNLFNDRLTAFFYRAWAKYRVPIAVERGAASGQDGVSEALRGLIGFGTDHLSGRIGVAEHSLLHYSGFFGHFPRNPASLASLLCDYFDLPIRVEPFDGSWLPLPQDQRTTLGASDGGPGSFARLSVDAVVGESYFDVESSFTIEIGPLDYADFESFLPDGDKLRRLASLTRLYVNPELGVRVELCLRRAEVPLLQLGSSASTRPLLGWNTWLRHFPMAQDRRDAAYRF